METPLNVESSRVPERGKCVQGLKPNNARGCRPEIVLCRDEEGKADKEKETGKGRIRILFL